MFEFILGCICFSVLCTDYKPRNRPLVDENALTGNFREPDRAMPDDYVHMFLSNSERLIDFLEHMIATDAANCSSLVYNALIEHYLHVWYVYIFFLCNSSKIKKSL